MNNFRLRSLAFSSVKCKLIMEATWQNLCHTWYGKLRSFDLEEVNVKKLHKALQRSLFCFKLGGASFLKLRRGDSFIRFQIFFPSIQNISKWSRHLWKAFVCGSVPTKISVLRNCELKIKNVFVRLPRKATKICAQNETKMVGVKWWYEKVKISGITRRSSLISPQQQKKLRDHLSSIFSTKT